MKKPRPVRARGWSALEAMPRSAPQSAKRFEMRDEEIVVGGRKFWLVEVADTEANVFRYHVRENGELILKDAGEVKFETEHDAAVMEIGSAREVMWNNLKEQLLNGTLAV
jgi:hypothetical protein